MADDIIARRHCNAKVDLSADYLRSILDYDAETGLFTWRLRTDVPREWNTRRAGTLAGCLMTSGYWMIAIISRRYLGHRLAWLHFHGVWPTNQIDHINMVRSDNRIANLREADNGQNNSNRAGNRDSISGRKGVHWHRPSGLWHVRITHHGVEHSFGYYRDPGEAAAVYAKEARRIHGDFARSS